MKRFNAIRTHVARHALGRRAVTRTRDKDKDSVAHPGSYGGPRRGTWRASAFRRGLAPSSASAARSKSAAAVQP